MYQEATKQFATEPNIFCGLAAVLVELGRPADAIKIYEDCIEKLGPNILAISGRAQALIRMGRFDDLIAEYEKAIADFPTESVPRRGLAEALKARRPTGKCTGSVRFCAKRFSIYGNTIFRLRGSSER